MAHYDGFVESAKLAAEIEGDAKRRREAAVMAQQHEHAESEQLKSAWRVAQRANERAAQLQAKLEDAQAELHRWEDEGGAVADTGFLAEADPLPKAALLGDRAPYEQRRAKWLLFMRDGESPVGALYTEEERLRAIVEYGTIGHEIREASNG